LASQDGSRNDATARPEPGFQKPASPELRLDALVPLQPNQDGEEPIVHQDEPAVPVAAAGLDRDGLND
jgi:hypothetical protein